MSKRSDPAAFARAKGAGDSLNLTGAPQPEASPAGALAPRPADAPPMAVDEDGDSLTPYIDANGFDPADYRFVPVRVRPRKDGWSEAKQRAFIEILADTGCVETAAREVGMSVRGCYALRRAPGAESFAAAWEAATRQAALKLVDLAFDRAIHGSDEPVFDKNGNRVGRRMRQNDRLLMFLLRAYMPERFHRAHENARGPREAPPAPVPVAQVIARLEPVVPPDAHRLMAPEELDVEIHVADMCNGELPSWYRHTPHDDPPAVSPRDAEFERELEAAKRGDAAYAAYLAGGGLGDDDRFDDEEP